MGYFGFAAWMTEPREVSEFPFKWNLFQRNQPLFSKRNYEPIDLAMIPAVEEKGYRTGGGCVAGHHDGPYLVIDATRRTERPETTQSARL